MKTRIHEGQFAAIAAGQSSALVPSSIDSNACNYTLLGQKARSRLLCNSSTIYTLLPVRPSTAPLKQSLRSRSRRSHSLPFHLKFRRSGSVSMSACSVCRLEGSKRSGLAGQGILIQNDLNMMHDNGVGRIVDDSGTNGTIFRGRKLTEQRQRQGIRPQDWQRVAPARLGRWAPASSSGSDH